MPMTYGLPAPKTKSRLRYVFLIILLFGFFLMFFIGIFVRWFVLHDVNTIRVEKQVINESALNNLVSSAQSSFDSRLIKISTQLVSSSFLEPIFISSSKSSSLNSMITSLLKEKNVITTSTTTTTLDMSYTSYKAKIPLKYRYCNPLTRRTPQGNIIPPDICLVVDESCCPACYTQKIDGKNKTISYGGNLEAINSKYYKNGESTEPDYYEDFLHNCTGFGVVCRMYPSSSGCNYNARCVNGLCTLASRF